MFAFAFVEQSVATLNAPDIIAAAATHRTVSVSFTFVCVSADKLYSYLATKRRSTKSKSSVIFSKNVRLPQGDAKEGKMKEGVEIRC